MISNTPAESVEVIVHHIKWNNEYHRAYRRSKVHGEVPRTFRARFLKLQCVHQHHSVIHEGMESTHPNAFASSAHEHRIGRRSREVLGMQRNTDTQFQTATSNTRITCTCAQHKTLEDEVKNLFERENHPSTVNHYFYDTYHKNRIRRFQQAVQSRLDFITRHKTYTATEVCTMMSGVMAETIGNASNAEQEAQDMVDVLSAYWKVMMFKRWTDNLAQAVDTCYVSQLVEPCRQALRIRFSMLGSRQEKQVRELFEEPIIDRQRRAELNEKLSRMKRAIQELDRLCESPCNDIVVDYERDGWDNLCETTKTDKV